MGWPLVDYGIRISFKRQVCRILDFREGGFKFNKRLLGRDILVKLGPAAQLFFLFSQINFISGAG